jgi:hypothetical protein
MNTESIYTNLKSGIPSPVFAVIFISTDLPHHKKVTNIHSTVLSNATLKHSKAGID